MGSRVTRVIGFLTSNFQRPKPFHSRLGTGQRDETERQRPSMHYAPHYGDRGITRPKWSISHTCYWSVGGVRQPTPGRGWSCSAGRSWRRRLSAGRIQRLSADWRYYHVRLQSHRRQLRPGRRLDVADCRREVAAPRRNAVRAGHTAAPAAVVHRRPTRSAADARRAGTPWRHVETGRCRQSGTATRASRRAGRTGSHRQHPCRMLSARRATNCRRTTS